MTLTPMEQRLQALERAVGELLLVQNHYAQTTGPAQQQVRPRLEEATKRVKLLRVAALQTIQSGDTRSLIRALGVVHAFDVCMTLGVGSLPGLISCTRSQFSLRARPANLGWGALEAVPVEVDNSIVIEVSAVLHALGLRWREPHEKARVRLPEPVLGRAFNAGLDIKARFTPDVFTGVWNGAGGYSYAHPTLINGVPGQCGPLVNELAARGIYCWEDLTLRSVADLRRTGFHGSSNPKQPEGQLALIQREMRRRGLSFSKEGPPAPIEMDVIDVDRINRESIDEKELLSFEDRIKVRDKVGQVVSTIDVKNEFDDRLGAEDPDQVNYSDQGNTVGVLETYEEGEEVDVAEEPETQPTNNTQAPQPPA